MGFLRVILAFVFLFFTGSLSAYAKGGMDDVLTGQAAVLVQWAAMDFQDEYIYTLPNLGKPLPLPYAGVVQEENPIAGAFYQANLGTAYYVLSLGAVWGGTYLLDRHVSPIVGDVFLAGCVFVEIHAMHTWQIPPRFGPPEVQWTFFTIPT